MEKYPEYLPKIPVYNDLKTCVNCNYAWLDIDNSPDFNHCVPMVDPEYSFDKLTPEQRKEFMAINRTAQCPLYDPKSEKGPKKIKTF